VLLGNSQAFLASVVNTNDTVVAWSVNGVPDGNSTIGIITTGGVYTASSDLPTPATVQVTATSHADPTVSGSAELTILSDVTIGLTPTGTSVEWARCRHFTP
jgi:hypothetical protein